MTTTNQLTQTERKVLALFFTGRNEEGRVQVWTVREMRAARKLEEKGMLRVSPRCRYHWQTPCPGGVSCQDYSLDLWRIDAAYTAYVEECVAFYGGRAVTEVLNGRPEGAAEWARIAARCAFQIVGRP
jgi:hypothetical protein